MPLTHWHPFLSERQPNKRIQAKPIGLIAKLRAVFSRDQDRGSTVRCQLKQKIAALAAIFFAPMTALFAKRDLPCKGSPQTLLFAIEQVGRR